MTFVFFDDRVWAENAPALERFRLVVIIILETIQLSFLFRTILDEIINL